MIHGPSKLVRVIVAKILPGYSNFVDSSFDRDFFDGEPLVVYYPPDHENAGQKYPYKELETKDSSTQNLNIMGVFVKETPRIESEDEKNDPIKKYHTSITLTPIFSAKEGFGPATNATGLDTFVYRGSIIQGLSSGTKRFYDGPFFGFTVEKQEGCSGSTDVYHNNFDGSSCQGNLKGSFYEDGYKPNRHDVFNYMTGQSWYVNDIVPYNNKFMAGTPFSLDMSWLLVRDRNKRPIPYRMDIHSHSAVTITRKHVLISGTKGYAYPYKFVGDYGGRYYIRQINEYQNTTTGPFSGSDAYTRDFKNMWSLLGFPNPETQWISSYNAMMSHFVDCTIVTLTDDLSGKTLPISLIDDNTSQQFNWAMVIGQEGRGHLTHNCHENPNYKEWSFSPCFSCSNESKLISKMPPNCTNSDVGMLMCVGDEGSPLITYYRGSPVFLGMLTSYVNDSGTLKYYDYNKTITATPKGRDKFCTLHNETDYRFSGQLSRGQFLGGSGIGSSVEYSFPWGKMSPIQFLNMWLNKDGPDYNGLNYNAKTVSLIREETDTQFTFPAP